MDDDQSVQAAINRRFANLSANNLHPDGVEVCAPCTLNPPPNFEGVWHAVEDWNVSDYFTRERVARLRSCAAILLIGDPCQEDQVDRVCLLADMLQNRELNNPCTVIWMPHTREHGDLSRNGIEQDVVDRVLSSGVDDTICSEPHGIMLLFAVHSCISKKRLNYRRVLMEITERQELNDQAQRFQNSIDHTVWEYLRERLQIGIPSADPTCSRGTPTSVHGLNVAELLGSGRFAKVYSLQSANRGPSGQVIKCIEKGPISSISGLGSLKNQISIMRTMAESNRHPNIVLFHQVYHTLSHILIRMEDAGHFSLFSRLILRSREESQWPLSLVKVVALIQQSISAIAHLHTRCSTAHRDIKPENICIHEGDEDIRLKIIDFDVAVVCGNSGQMCRSSVGTFPFMAPEVHLQERYLPYPADIWSLGNLLCEIIFTVHFLSKLLFGRCSRDQFTRLHATTQENHNMWVASQRIRNFFATESAIGDLLRTHTRAELRPLQDSFAVMLNGMMRTHVPDRVTAEELLHQSQSSSSTGF